MSYALVTSNATLPGIANIVLNYAKVFTKSESGYVSSIDPQTKNNLCHTLTGIMGDSCKISDYEKGIVFPVGPDGKYPTLWGHCLNTREAFYTNTVACTSTLIAMILGTLAAAALYKKKFFGKETISLLIILPIWMLTELVRPRQRPVTNMVAVFILAVTFIPILFAYYFTQRTQDIEGGGK